MPLDFDWPCGVIWKGYRNPYSSQQCERCKGGGLTGAAQIIADDFYRRAREDGITQAELDALLADERLRELTHDRNGKPKSRPPTLDEVNAWIKSSVFSIGGSERWICVRVFCDAHGVPMNCPLCKGHGHYWCDEKYAKLSEEWEPIDPPAGEGYQLWETTSEGSPKSPVFKTLDELCEWCADHATTFADFTATAEEWKRMLEGDFVHHRQGNMVFL